MLEAGRKGMKEMEVTPADTARAYKSGTLDVLATPRMLALMEETAWTSVAGALGEGQGTVGTRLEVSHVAPTPVGMRVRCETELTEVDGRRLVFAVEAWDEAGKIGEGTHERFVVDEAKFQGKADRKRVGP